jgi:AbrB family looped-hinge helix DNA binding protein
MAWVTTLTREGQVSLPEEIRDELGLQPADRVEIRLENGEVRLRKADLTLEEVTGRLPPLGMPVEQAIAEAKDERARRFWEKLRQS